MEMFIELPARGTDVGKTIEFREKVRNGVTVIGSFHNAEYVGKLTPAR